MRVLVTGGAGFIGSHLAERLVAEGHETVVLDDLSNGLRRNLPAGIAGFIEGDVREPAACARACAGREVVFHLAGLGSVPRSIKDPATSMAVNVMGTLHMLAAARDARVRRFIGASSSSVYGGLGPMPKTEEHPRFPLSPYAISKAVMEDLVRVYHALHGMESLALRYFNVFGPRQRHDSPYAAAIPRFIHAALTRSVTTIDGDGEQTRDFTYVLNVVEANLAAMRAPADRVAGRTFNVGAGGRTSVNRLWQTIAELVPGAPEPVHGPARVGDVRDSFASVEALRKAAGYDPRYTLADGLRDTVRWSRETTVVP